MNLPLGFRSASTGTFFPTRVKSSIESLTPEHYNAAGYYEKWAYALRGLLIEKGVVTEAEIDAKLAEVKARINAIARAGMPEVNAMTEGFLDRE